MSQIILMKPEEVGSHLPGLRPPTRPRRKVELNWGDVGIAFLLGTITGLLVAGMLANGVL